MDNKFPDWLIREMQKRGWSQSDLAKASGLSRQAISDYINRRRNSPDEKALKGIAHAFGLPPETIFRIAGLLPHLPPEDAEWEIWKDKLRKLTPENRDRFRRIMETELQYQQAEEERASAAKRKSSGPVPNTGG